MKKYIVTHTNPDLDAICAVWLLRRFGDMQDHEVAYVNTGSPDQDILEKADAVVDTGKVYDPHTMRFDHHQLPGRKANETSAAMQVYSYVHKFNVFNGKYLDYLFPLIELVMWGDTDQPEANHSRQLGLHAIFSGSELWFLDKFLDMKRDDTRKMRTGCVLLDYLEAHLRHKRQAIEELDEKTVYKSDDGLVWAIRHGSIGSSFAAGDEGARLIIFEGKPLEVEGGTTYPVGIQRTGEYQEPHCGELVDVIVEAAKFDIESGTPGNFSLEHELVKELSTWFKHNSGFFAGRGTAKAPVFEPVEVDIVEVARLVDSSWKR